MPRNILLTCILLALPAFCRADGEWVLQQSTLSYHMSHPMHQVDGVSRAAKGKGACHAGTCDFLIAAPVNTFDSGDSNRDLHMVQVTRGAQFPMVVVRTRIPEQTPASGTIYADLEVQFAGQTVKYDHVPFEKSADRRRRPHHGNSSCHMFRFQDRSAVVPGDSNQERNPRSRRHDVAADVGPTTFLRHKHPQPHMPLRALARLQRHHPGVHLAPLLAEGIGEVVLVLNGHKLVVGGAYIWMVLISGESPSISTPYCAAGSITLTVTTPSFQSRWLQLSS